MEQGQNVAQELMLFARHVSEYNRKFRSKQKLPRPHEWKPIRFAVRDVILALIALRQEEKNNILLVDVCLTENPPEIVGWSGTRIATIFILSEAYKSGSSMGIRFTSDFGNKSRPVPGQIFDLAFECGIELKKASEGVITPKEARHLYLALTEFTPEAAQRAMELSLADKVSPERVCYMVHHLTYTREEMESLLLGTEFPENILLGKITPEEYLLYQDVVLRTRDIVLGGILDRTLKLKEVVGVDGDVEDLEDSDRLIAIGFESSFFAKVYETREETPVPWTANRNWVVQAGERLVVMVRARDWADFVYYIKTDAHALQWLKQAYADKPTHFFLLVPRNVLEISEQDLERYRKALLQIGVTLMICPESVALLDTEVMRRLRECETMRHDVGSGEEREDIKAIMPRLDYNSTEIRLVAVPRDLQIGRLLLSQLTEQAVYDEDELRRGVNKYNVRTRYHLFCDRIQFLAHQALMQNQYPSIVLDSGVLPILSALWGQVPDRVRQMRVLPTFWVQEQFRPYAESLKTLSQQIDLAAFRQIIEFLSQANRNNQIIIAVQNKHAQQTQSVGQTVVSVEQLTKAFTGQFVPDWINDYGNLPFDEVVVKHLWRAVSSARRGQANGVNLSEVPHMFVTRALRQMVYERPPKGATGEIAVNIVYTDGSQARPFQLFALKPRSDSAMRELRSQSAIRMGMISMRHPEMDSMIHQYWFRNIEVSQPGMTSAEVDELCYQITLKKLGDIYRLNKPVRFEFYQTGFQAPLVGFWRAVVEFLEVGQGRPPMLEIIPCFYTGTKKDSEEMLNAIRTGRQPRVNYEQLYARGTPWV